MPEQKSLEEELRGLGETDSSDTKKQSKEDTTDIVEETSETEEIKEKPNTPSTSDLSPTRKPDICVPYINDLPKPKEERVEVIKGPVSVSIVYRKSEYWPFNKNEIIIYVTTEGKEKQVYRFERSGFSSSGLPKKVIQNVVLSPGNKRIAFDVITSSPFGYIYKKHFRLVYVVDVDGKNLSEIDNVNITLPKNKRDREKEERRKKEQEKLKEKAPLSYHLRGYREFKERREHPEFIPSPELDLYSPRWVKRGRNKGKLEFRGKLYYAVKNDPVLIAMESRREYVIHASPECLIRVKLNEENQIEDSELVKMLE